MNWHGGIVTTRSDLTEQHYHSMGKRFIEAYYKRYSALGSDTTISTEMRLDSQFRRVYNAHKREKWLDMVFLG